MELYSYTITFILFIKCIINDALIVEVYGGDDGCSWTINTLIDKSRMYCNNLGQCIIICIIPYGTGDDLSRVLGWGVTQISYYKDVYFCSKNNNVIVDIPDR